MKTNKNIRMASICLLIFCTIFSANGTGFFVARAQTTPMFAWLIMSMFATVSLVVVTGTTHERGELSLTATED